MRPCGVRFLIRFSWPAAGAAGTVRPMIFENFRPWVELVIVLWNCALTGVLWLRKPGVDAARAVDELRVDMDGRLYRQAQQITAIQTHMEHMPTNDELVALEGAVKEINERAAGLARNMDTVRASLHRIEDYLLRGKRA